jgi:hypothetical protein
MTSDCGLHGMCCAPTGNRDKSKENELPKEHRFLQGFQRVKTPAKPYSNQNIAGHDNEASFSNANENSPNKGSATKSNRDSLERASIPVWLRDPEPMTNWTVQQQKLFITQLNETPYSRKHSDHLQKAIEKTHRLMPEKTIQEIEECYKHLQVKRIAYFGPTDHK